jgi:hypothetical protein
MRQQTKKLLEHSMLKKSRGQMMKNYKFYIYGLPLLLLLGGCSGDSTKSSTKKDANVDNKTLSIRVLGTQQEWQKDPVEKNWHEAKKYCENLTLESKNDWRLPSSKEFFALLDNNKSIDENFPKISSIKEFWSSDETSFDIDQAWKISAWSNSESYTDKNKILGVRCIRGEKLPTHVYKNEDGTLKDTISSSNELKWQDDKDSSTILVTYEEAKNYCKAKSQRLPTIFELQNMVEKKSLTSPFSYLNSSDFIPYWSSTPQPTNQKEFLTLNYMTAGVNFSNKDSKNFVRCVKDINHAPTLNISQTVSVDEDNQVTIELKGEDIDNDQLSVIITQEPKNGIYKNGTYKPNANYYGTDTIKYKVSDGKLESYEATVTITVNPVNDKPVAIDINTSTTEDMPKNITLLYTDIDSDNFTFIITNPSHGEISGKAPNLIYTPKNNYNGTDLFTYKVNDGTNDSNIATVKIAIGEKNDAPSALAQSLTTDEDTELSVILSGTDPENSSLSYEIISQPQNGQLTGSNNSYIYMPNSNYNGHDNFTFRVNDGKLNSELASVNIEITPVNDKPIVKDINITLDEDNTKNITLFAKDDDNDTLTYTITNSTTNGTLDGNASNLTYIPFENYNGIDSFTYKVNDGKIDSSEAVVHITVNDINDKPIADAGSDIVADEGINITLDGSNSRDVDGTITSYLWREGGSELATTASFSKIFTPGSHIVTLQVTDDKGLISTDEITITINATNQSEYSAYNITNHAKEFEWAELSDIDSDGDIDILSASSGDGDDIAWYENRGDGNFTEHIIASNTDNSKFILATDIDDDGDKDILYTTHTQNESLMFCDNNGSEDFTCSAVTNAIDSLVSLAVVDIDKDGKKDIVSASCDNNRVDWYKNNGNGNFSIPSLIDNTNLDMAISLSSTDINHDGNIDIVVASKDNGKIYWYENRGNETFTTHKITDVDLVYSVFDADINGDGFDDILFTSNQDEKVYWQKNSTNFSDRYTVANLTNVLYASAVDMDGDGDLDILSNSYEANGKIAWYENIGNNENFTEHIVATGANNIKRVFASDIDNDGNIDIISGDSSGNIVFYKNNNPITITLIPKTGDASDGDHGGDFSFSRADNIVTDSLTNLMWQDDENASLNPKTWDELDLENGCNISLGGYTDWRFPNRHELYYLAQKDGDILDSIFENIGSGILTSKDYWTSSPKKIYVSFSRAISREAISKNYTRCVRGKPITFNFIRDDAKEVVLDKQHKLMWEDGVDSSVRTSSTGVDEAKSICSSLDYLGYSDWRLPNIHELYSIFDEDGLVKSFKNREDENSILISSTSYNHSYISTSEKVYAVDIKTGLETQIDKTSSVKVRCVRDIL